MRRLLIEKGIPEKEVVFIHDYNTRKQKEDLFEAVNKGDIRIVLAAKLYCNNKVEAFYYATERTLDASMYNTVSQKAKFIAQLKTTVSADVRIIKDIEEDVDMGSMAAELSGDPVFTGG